MALDAEGRQDGGLKVSPPDGAKGGKKAKGKTKALRIEGSRTNAESTLSSAQVLKLRISDRAAVELLHNANVKLKESLAEMLQDKSRKRLPSEQHPGDQPQGQKQEQIPKILAVNEEVKRTFSKAMQRRLTNFNNSLSLQLHAEVFK